jgi:hypothetical protein
METKTIDQQTFKMSWKVALFTLVAALGTSNTFTAYRYQIEENAMNVAYNEEKTNRKLKNQLEKVEQLIHISELKAEIIHLNHELEQCKE